MVHDGECTVINRLPVEWQGLLKKLESSVEQGNIWFTEETSSKYGCQPAWHKLFTALIKCDPCIEENRLVFKPRFLLLPAKVQENLVRFFQHQSYIIPDMYIKELVLGLISCTDLQTDLRQLLTQLFQETKFPDDLLTESVKTSTIQSDDLCTQALKTTTIKSDDSTSEKTNPLGGNTSLPGSQDSVIILDESVDETEEPACKRIKLAEEAKEFENEQSVGMETSSEEHNDTKMVETTRKDIDVDFSSSLVHFAGKEHILCKIKEIWQSGNSDREIEGLSEVSKLSLKEIEEFCQIMDFDSMSDDSIELVCQHLCQLSDSLSYSSAVCILTFVLGHRITQLSQNASRKLSGAVTLVAQKFPKQAVESVFVPCMMQPEISTAQSEILCKTIKDCLSASAKGYFVQKLMQNDFTLNENKVPVFQTTIESSCDLTFEVVSSLLNCLNEASLSMAKNLKFGKLVLALVNKHCKLFNQELKTKVEKLLDKHSTFLKKSIQSSLNKIKNV